MNNKIVHKIILPSSIALVTTVNLLGCTGESTFTQLVKDTPLMRSEAPYEPPPTRPTVAYSTPKATGKKRVALIIGNADYTAVGKLKNPTNDAQDLATELRSLGFEVNKKENVETSKEMRQLVQDFGNKLRGGGVGLFYYSGHGIQVNGENYLIPTTANLRSEVDVGYDALGMKYVQATLDEANNGMNLVILDACRDNPFARSLRRSTRGGPTSGLAHMDSAKGSLVAFSTAPGATAEDGSGRNGTYTKHLLANIKQPGLNVEGLFKRVRNGVTEETGGQQTPWESTSLTGDFCFAGCEDPTVAQTKIEAEKMRQKIEQQQLETERLKVEAENLKKHQAATEAKRIADQEQARQQAIAAANQKAKAAAHTDEQARLAAISARQKELENLIRDQLDAARQKKTIEEEQIRIKQERQEAYEQAQLKAQEAARQQAALAEQIRIKQEQQETYEQAQIKAQEETRQQAEEARQQAFDERIRIQREQQEAEETEETDRQQALDESRESGSNKRINIGTF